MHRLLLLSVIFMTSICSKAQIFPDSTTQAKMRLECDSFLIHMPEGLQHKQSEAIRMAMKGIYSALDKIRRGRNTPYSLPHNIQTEYITANLCLFKSKTHSDSLRPVLLYLHGGGWTFGSVNSCSRFCAAVAEASNCIVAALNYRLAPEFPFPIPLNDCIEAFRFLKEHIETQGGNPNRISIGGDSAGGNLAIASALRIPDVYSIIAIYPVTKVYTANSTSWNQYAEGYGCDAELLETFNTAYSRDKSHHPMVSVALASEEQIKKLPSTLFISAGRDILLDQGLFMVDLLRKAGIHVKHIIYPTATHLFITVPGQTTAFEKSVIAVSDFLTR